MQQFTDSSGAKALARIICSGNVGDSDQKKVGFYLRRKVFDSAYKLLLWKHRKYPTENLTDVAFHFRQLLEVSATSLLLRVDPLRVLMVWQAQRSGSYDIRAKNSIVIQWTGDVLPKTDLKIEGKTDPTKVDRSLFSKIAEQLVWMPALSILNDKWSASPNQDDWKLESARLAPTSFLPSCKSQLNASFSLASKLIHSELIVNPGLITAQDFRDQIPLAVKWLSLCAAALCYSPLLRENQRQEVVDQLHGAVEKHFGIF